MTIAYKKILEKKIKERRRTTCMHLRKKKSIEKENTAETYISEVVNQNRP